MRRLLGEERISSVSGFYQLVGELAGLSRRLEHGKVTSHTLVIAYGVVDGTPADPTKLLGVPFDASTLVIEFGDAVQSQGVAHSPSR